MPTQIILLERVESLGAMGDVVTVKPGYARNYLLPQNKALRATKENIAYFETQKAHLQKANAEKKGEAEKVAKKVEGTKLVLIRQAAEGGQLFGSVTSRDIADVLTSESGQTVTRGQVALNQNFKTIGLFDVDVILHPEVKVKVKVNIARSASEAETQEKTGKAVIADARAERGGRSAEADAREGMLEDEALASARDSERQAAKDEAEAAEKAAAKAANKKPKKAGTPDGADDDDATSIG